MSNSAKSKLYAFERALFLKSRTMKTAGAFGAVGALSAILDDLGTESIVQTDPVANAAFAKLSADIGTIGAALQTGATDVAVQLYAGLVSAMPTIHSLVYQALPEEVRGSGPTDHSVLTMAAQRASAILGL
ncbi:MAG: hypothetical protein H6923_05260 [Alphaproteobacteria bacterium]|nr:hypothetical protein [Alphaproteobacteria bacterium]